MARSAAGQPKTGDPRGGVWVCGLGMEHGELMTEELEVGLNCTGAGRGITDLAAAAVQLRLGVASGLQTFTAKSGLLTGENAVQFRGNPPFPVKGKSARA